MNRANSDFAPVFRFAPTTPADACPFLPFLCLRLGLAGRLAVVKTAFIRAIKTL
jgi:hypothetical protein